MKSPHEIRSLSIVCIIMMLNAGAGFASTVTTAGLSVHYRADNVDGQGNPGNASTSTLVNLAGNSSYNGSMQGIYSFVENADQPTGSPYKFGLQLDGRGFIDLSAFTFASNNPANMTMEFWVKMQDGGRIYSEGHSDGLSEAQARNALDIYPASMGFEQYPPSGGNKYTGSMNIADEYRQMIFVKSGNSHRFYVDGGLLNMNNGIKVVVNQQAEYYTGPSITSAWIGARHGFHPSNYPNGAPYGITGQINVVRLYQNTALTDQQIYDNYLAELNNIAEPIPAPLAVVGGLAMLSIIRYKRRSMT